MQLAKLGTLYLPPHIELARKNQQLLKPKTLPMFFIEKLLLRSLNLNTTMQFPYSSRYFTPKIMTEFPPPLFLP
jgi:hypothetical protein